MNRVSPMKSMLLAGAGFALTSLALLSAGTGGDTAQAQALANHNSAAPVDFDAGQSHAFHRRYAVHLITP